MDDFNYAPDPRRRPRQLTGVQITFAMIIAFGLILAINFSSRIAAGQPLQERFNDVEAEVEQLREEQATLNAVRDFSQGDSYVEQWARSEGKMVRENEILIVPVPAVAPVAAQPTPTPGPVIPVQTTDPQPENWMLWWQLFFDGPPPG
ncbi:MAG: septum formation initiator family protein [Chloroflexota bacterium]